MMTIECAISLAMKRAAKVQAIIEKNEASWKSMDKTHRDELGMLRCLMAFAGIERDKLPEVPFLEPEHLEAFKKKQAEWAAQKKAENADKNIAA